MLTDPDWGDARSEVVQPAFFERLAPAWGDLCSRAVEDNLYYSPRFAQSLLRTVAPARQVRLALAWKGNELIGLLPFTGPNFSLHYLRNMGMAWTTKFTFSSLPLLDAAQLETAASLLLDALASAGRIWAIPTINIEGPACRALIGSLEERGLAWAASGLFERAILTPGSCSFEEHLERSVASVKRREIARNRRRLQTRGTLEYKSYRSGQALARAVRDFLVLESRGWKGRRRSAMACEDASRRFALDVFTGCARDCRADVLTLDGRPIAVSLAIRAGRTGFAIKRAYDENYRAFGPGRILDFEMTRNFFAEKWAERVDSGTSGRHVIDSLWPERMKMAQLVFSFDRRRGERDVSRACAAYRQTRRIKTLVAGAWSGVTHQTLRGLVARGKGLRPSMRMR